MENSHPGLRKLLNKFEGVLQEALPAGLPLVMSVDHAIEVNED